MGFWSRFFQHPLSEKDLARVATELAGALAEVRKGWFRACVTGLEQASEMARQEGRPIDLRVVRRELGGEAEVAIQAFQLPLASDFIEKRSYLPARQRQDFDKLLLQAVCGPDAGKTLRYVAIHSGKPSEQLTRVAFDVAHYISERESLKEGTFVLQVMLEKLVHLTRASVAAAFMDEATFRAEWGSG